MKLKTSKNFFLLLVTKLGNPLRTRSLCGFKTQQDTLLEERMGCWRQAQPLLLGRPELQLAGDCGPCWGHLAMSCVAG